MSLLMRMYPGDGWAFEIGVVLVQITVIGILGWLVSRIGRCRAAHVRHVIWVSTLIGVLASPLLTVSMYSLGISFLTLNGFAQDSATSSKTPPKLGSVPIVIADRNEDAISDTDVPIRRTDASLKLSAGGTQSADRSDVLRACGGVAVVAWLTGVVYFMLQGCHGLRIVRSLRRSARPWADHDQEGILDDVRRLLGRADLPQIACSDRIDGPLVVGMIRPLVLLPASMDNAVNRECVRDVLIHECAHVLRRDSIVGILQRTAKVLFWPHPIVHYINEQLARAREEVCDNYVLRCGNPTRYARTLFELAQHVSRGYRQSAAFGLFPPRWRLEDRIARLLDSRRQTMTRMSRLAIAGFITMSLSAALVIAGVGSEDQLKKLLQERLETAKEYADTTAAAYETDTCPLFQLLDAQKMLRDVRLDSASTPAERIAVLESHLQFMSHWEKKIEVLYNKGLKGGEAEKFHLAKLERQNAEIDLLREKMRAK